MILVYGFRVSAGFVRLSCFERIFCIQGFGWRVGGQPMPAPWQLWA